MSNTVEHNVPPGDLRGRLLWLLEQAQRLGKTGAPGDTHFPEVWIVQQVERLSRELEGAQCTIKLAKYWLDSAALNGVTFAAKAAGDVLNNAVAVMPQSVEAPALMPARRYDIRRDCIPGDLPTRSKS